MNNIAIGLAIMALAFGGYTLLELKKIDGGVEPASAESVEALQKQVVSLGDALATETTAREAAEARLSQSERDAKERDGRLAALEARKPDSGALTVTELIVQSADGKELLRLGATKQGGGRIEVFAKNGTRAADLRARSDHDGELLLYDESGALGVSIGGNITGGYANFYGPGRELAAYIGADSKKPSGYVAVYGAGKKQLVGLYANDKGGFVSVRCKETGKQVVQIGAAADSGTGLIGVAGPEGRTGLALFVTKSGGQMKAYNADGKTAAFLGVSADPAGNGLLYVSRKDGGRIAEIGANSALGGYMSIRNSLDERVLFLGASTGDTPDDGVLEVERKGGKLGVVLRAYSGGSSVRVYDSNEKVKVNLR